MGGKVAKKLGDGLRVLFGYPVAQENDASRAVPAAIRLLRNGVFAALVETFNILARQRRARRRQ
jgi:class 3 adenylate cyclase